jgi:chitodextrinase
VKHAVVFYLLVCYRKKYRVTNLRKNITNYSRRILALTSGFLLVATNFFQVLPSTFKASPTSVFAAGLAIDKTIVKHQTSASSSITSASFTTSQGSELLEAFLMADGPNPGTSSFSSVTGAGLTWTLRDRMNTQAGSSEIWQAWAPNVLSNVTVNATRASGSYNGSMVITTFTGAAQSQTGATTASNGASGAPGATLTTTAPGSWVFGVGNDWDNSTARTLGASQTMVDQYMSSTGDDFWVQRQNSTTASSGTTVTINDTAPTTDRWNIAAVEVVAAGAADTQPPTTPTSLVASAPAPNQVTLSWASSTDNVGVTGYKVFRAGIQVGTSPSPSYNDNTVTPNTSYTYNVSAYDAAGNNSSLSNNATVTTPADTIPPTVAMTAPTNGSTVAGTVNLAATASDNIGVSAVQFQIDGVNIGAAVTTPPYQVSWDSATASDGNHNLTAVAWDAAGNTATSTTVTVNVNNHDTIPPTVSITSPVNGAVVSGSVNVTANATDNVAVAKVQFTIDGSNLGTAVTGLPYSVSWDTTKVSNGSHILGALATDTTGNSATASQVTVITNNDFTPPTVSLTAPTNGSTVSNVVTVSANASDNVAVAGVQFKVDGVNIGTEVTTTPYSITWNTSSVSNGAHSLTATARDNSGNTASSTPISVTVNNAAGVAVTINGSATQQNIEGLGVNSIPKTWQGGALKPALDTLVGAGVNTWRVDVYNAHTDWELTNANSDPFTYNWTYYNSLYGGSQFSDLWNELSYLNNKGVSNIELSMSGLVPTWMSTAGDGHSITTANEDYFVQEITSLLYYAKNVKGIRFASVSPFNETDKTSTEGPTVGATQLAEILGKLATQLDQIGMSTIQIVGPHTTGFDTTYNGAIMGNAAAMSHIKGFAGHEYGVSANNSSYINAAYNQIKTSAYPDREIFVGEWNQCATDGCMEGTQTVKNEWNFARELTDELLNHLAAGASEVLQWDAWDNYHQHDPCCAYSGWGLLTQDNNDNWSARKRIYSNEQVFKFVAPGMTEVSSSVGNNNFDLVAFKNQSSGLVTIVGHNRNSSAVNLQVSMTGMPSVSSLSYYQTNATDNMAPGSDVLVSNGALSFQVPADTIFTVSNVKSVLDSTKAGPSISGISSNQLSSTSATVSWTTDAPSTSQVFYGPTGSYGSSTTLNQTLSTAHSVVISGLNPDTLYYFQVRSSDNSGVTNASEDNHFTTLLSNGSQSLSIDKLVSIPDIKSNSTLAIPAFSTSQNNELLELFVSSNGGTNDAVSSVSGGGLSWTLRARSNGHNGTSEIWQAVATQSLSGATFIVTMNQNNLTTVTLASFIGARTDLNGATATTSGASGAPSVTINTQNASSWVWGVGNDWSNEAARTPGTGQTLQYQLPILATSDTFWVQSNDNQSHAAGFPINISDTAPTTDMWNLAAIEIVPSFSIPDTQPPTTPTNLTAVANSPSQVGLSWTASTDNIGVTGYNIIRNGSQVGTTTNTSFTDSSVLPNTSYIYTVTAFDAAGNLSPASNSASVTTPADTVPPVLSGISASNISSASATISWATDKPSTSQVNYGTTASYGAQTVLNSMLMTSHSQTLSGLIASTTYHYQVASTDSSGNTATSGDLTFVTPATQVLAVDNSATTHQSSPSNSISSPGVTTTQAGDLLVAFLTSDGPSNGGSQSFSSVGGGGLTWTLRARSNAQAGTAEIWQAIASSVLTNVIVTANRANGSFTGTVTVVAFKGATTAINGTTKTTNATSGAPIAALTTTANGSWVWGVGNDWDSAVGRMIGPAQTLVDQYLAPTGDTFWVQRQTTNTPTSGTLVTINDTSPTADRWNLALIEILSGN